MGKVENLREKYPKIRPVTFEKLVAGDTTPTKKYLPYMLEICQQKSEVYGNISYKSIDEFIKEIVKFDKHLPYISNKDIYHSDYKEYGGFKDVLNKAIEKRNDSLFVREEHIDVLIENERFLLIRPKTHQGSLKYGAETRWCTAATHAPSTFNSYLTNNNLLYLIDKEGNKTPAGKKIAFLLDLKQPLAGNMSIYNSHDNQVYETDLINYGWNQTDIILMLMTIRQSTIMFNEIKKAKNELNKVVSFLEKLDLVKINNTIKFLKEQDEIRDEETIKLQKTIQEYINKLKTI